MNKVLSWIFTVIHAVVFFIIICVFHPLIAIGERINYYLGQWFCNGMNLSLLTNMRLTGTRYDIQIAEKPPIDRPVILVSNHQGMYDIPLIYWLFRKHHVKFIAKEELTHGVPSISYVLRNLKHCLIDRKDPRQAIPAIKNFGSRMQELNWMVSIFPEGTRGKDGVMKHFKPSGIKTLLKAMPSAVIMPVVIDGSWEYLRYKAKPIPYGITFSFHTFPLVEPGDTSAEELAEKLENIVRGGLEEIRSGANKG